MDYSLWGCKESDMNDQLTLLPFTKWAQRQETKLGKNSALFQSYYCALQCHVKAVFKWFRKYTYVIIFLYSARHRNEVTIILVFVFGLLDLHMLKYKDFQL